MTDRRCDVCVHTRVPPGLFEFGVSVCLTDCIRVELGGWCDTPPHPLRTCDKAATFARLGAASHSIACECRMRFCRPWPQMLDQGKFSKLL